MNEFLSLLILAGFVILGILFWLLVRSKNLGGGNLRSANAFQFLNGNRPNTEAVSGLIDVEKQVKIDQIVSRLSAQCMNTGLEDCCRMLDREFQVLGETLEKDQVSQIVFDHEHATIDMIGWKSSRQNQTQASEPAIQYHELEWCFERLRRGEVIQIPDASALPGNAVGERICCERMGVQSLLLFPMIVAEELLGALALGSSERSQNLPDELLESLWRVTHQLAYIVDRTKIKDTLLFQERRIRLLNEITHSALDAPDEQRMLEIVADKLTEFIHADACMILLGDIAGLSYRSLAIRGEAPQKLEAFAHDLEKFLPLRTLFHQGEHLMIDDLDNPVYGELSFGTAYKSLYSFPLLESDLTLGDVILLFRKSVRLNALEVELCEQIADQLSLAVIKIHALAEARARLGETEILREAASMIAATLEPDEAVDRILDELGRVVPYDSACVQILDDGFLEIIGGRGWSDNAAVLGMRFPVPADNPNSIVIETKAPFILGDAPEMYENFRYPPHNHIRSWLGVPLVVRGNLIGMFAIDKVEPNYFREEHVAQVSAFADQVAVLLENARLFENTQRRALELEALRATVADITAERDLSTLLRAIVERAATLLNLTGGELGLFDDKKETLEIVVSHNLGMNGQEIHLSLDEGIMGSVAKTLEPTLVEDYMAWEGRSLQYTGVALHAVAAAPLIIGSRLLGVIAIGTIDPDRRLSASDIKLLNLFAQQAAIAVENARLFETLQVQAVTDPLTGLFNRRGLFDFGQHEIEVAIRKSRPFSVIMFDIDHFKLINDRLSHAAGDDVLCELALRCRSILRRSDILGRYGGEEFAVLLPETELDDAVLIADRFRLAVSERPVNTRRGPVDLTISCGVTTACEDIPELAVLLDQADTALYSAKQAGRNQTHAFEKLKISSARF